MLAVLFIEMQWFKENRTPDGAIRRQEYYKPVRIEDNVNLLGEGVFLKKCQYYQRRNLILTGEDNVRLDQELLKQEKGKPFTGSDEFEQSRAKRRAESVNKDRGTFCHIDKLDIPCVKILKEADGSYRVKWFDCGMGKPVRRGGNEDLYKKASKLAGRPDLLNETAFILKEGQSGILKYNYRYSYYEGQWYKCFYVYVVNEAVLTRDIFLREYDYEYEQLADLF